MKNKYDSLVNSITLLYVLTPIVIFFIGWLWPIYSVPVSLLLICSGVFYANRINKKTEFYTLNVSWRTTALIALIAFAWVYCSGIGGYTNQDWDHHARNAIFYDLIKFDWPIYYNFPPNYHLKALAGKHSSLNYYFTFWLPAAYIGKIFGLQLANAFLLVWTYIGLLISFYYLNRLFTFKHSLACIGLFILWSNFDLISYLFVLHILHPIDVLAETTYFHFYTTFTTDLYNPFNQAVPAWVLTLHVLNSEKNLHIFPVVILLAYSPFAFIGLAIAHGVFYLFTTYRPEKNIAGYITELIQAIWRPETLGTISILIIFGLFYQAHSKSVQNTTFWSLYLTHSTLLNTFTVISYLSAFFLEGGIYLFVIYFLTKCTYYTNKIWFWLTFFVLLFLPLWVIGVNSDLASRASIPFLTILLIMTLSALVELYDSPGEKLKFYLVLSMLFISFQLPVFSFIRSLSFTDKPILRNAIGSLADPKLDESNDPEHMLSSINNFYSHDPHQFLFYRYVAKRVKPSTPHQPTVSRLPE